ncbi:MAG: glycosyl hydrolase family 18 protein [Bacillota bacterium]|nr:glycosyl hydrolase family 18 protein [Bacillota bacterium]MDW7676523.1 glycosyl hydrolase family 18 protein [Bacillota bacterium]
MDRRKEIEIRQNKVRIKWILFLVFIGSTLMFYLFGPDLISRLMARQETTETYSVVFKGRPDQVKVLIRQDLSFLPVEWVQEHLIPDMEILKQSGKARWIPEADDIRFTSERVTELVTDVSFPLEVNLLEEEDYLYFPVSGTASLLRITTVWHPETGILVVDEATTPIQQGEILERTALRSGTGRFDTKIVSMDSGEKVRVLEIYENHYHVLSESGMLGFLPQSAVGGLRRMTPNVHNNLLKSASPEVLLEPFGLVWDYVSGTHPNRSNEDRIDALAVFSPTWFELKDADGHLENRAQFRYAHKMKKEGYQLWGLVTNAFDPDMTEAFMQNDEGRRRFISQLLVYAALYELDGINIDFENMHFRNQDLFTGFVRELSEALKHQGLVVSIDVTIPGGSLNWSQVYDRSALEPHVDYFAVMTYDEHWGSSPVAGSVASIGWVERGIEATLEEVPPEKVLLGLPLYTRLWEETPRAGGEVSVTSRSMGMQFIRRTLEDNGVFETDWEWLDPAGQYYAEYDLEGKRYRVWLEDERSLTLKAMLVDKYHLAGIAAWRKDFELPEVWEVLGQFLQEQQRLRKH